VGLTDAELAQRAGIDVAWLDEFKTGYASDKSASVAVTERVLNGVGLTLMAKTPE
jgi:transcriptional regulator with XRE-family HTH domain